MEKKDLCLNLYLGSLKQSWILHCEKLGKKPSTFLKEIVQEQLKNPSIKTCSKLTSAKQTKESPDDQVKHRYEVLLTPSEKAALEKRAQQEQCSQRRWVIDAIRTGLTKQAQFSMREIEKLGKSNYQLLIIGRNLNQIAKALNQGDEPKGTLEFVQELRKMIEIHTKTVSRAIRASLERWDIK